MFYNYNASWMRTLHFDTKRNNELIQQFSIGIHFDDDMKKLRNGIEAVINECKGQDLIKYYKRPDPTKDELYKIFKENCEKIRKLNEQIDQVEV